MEFTSGKELLSGLVETPGNSLGTISNGDRVFSALHLSGFIPHPASREKIAYFTRAKISIPSLPADDV